MWLVQLRRFDFDLVKLMRVKVNDPLSFPPVSGVPLHEQAVAMLTPLGATWRLGIGSWAFHGGSTRSYRRV